MNTILVPLDGSRLSEAALPPALSLARRSGANVRLVQVAPSLPFAPEGIESPASREWVEGALADVARRIREAVGMEVERTVLTGDDVPAALVSSATEVGAELIVMSTHGRGPFSRLWLGSVSDRVLRTAPCPVLVVRPEGEATVDVARDWEVGTILVPLDGSRVSERALGPAAEVARATDARLSLLRVVETPPVPVVPESAHYPDLRLAEEERVRVGERLEETAEELRRSGLEVTTRSVVALRATEAVLEAVEESGADLVAMGTRGRSGPARAFLGSVTDKVVRAAEVPVLVVPPGPGDGSG